MTFDQLDPKKQDLLADAYRSDMTHRFRTMVALPIGGTALAVLWWFLLRGDDSGGGWIMMLLMGGPIAGMLLWMLFQAFTLRRVTWALRSFDLDPEAAKELAASLKTTRQLARERNEARAVITEEFKEGAKAAAEKLVE